jgi:hypothetical protein
VIAGVQRNPGSQVIAANEQGDAVVAWIEATATAGRGERGSIVFDHPTA